MASHKKDSTYIRVYTSTKQEIDKIRNETGLPVILITQTIMEAGIKATKEYFSKIRKSDSDSGN